MTQPSTLQLIEAVLGSTRVFSKAIHTVVEGGNLPEPGEARLTSVQLIALKLISQKGSRTLGELAALLDVSSAAACKLVDRLVRRRLLERMEGTTDRRLTQLVLTPAGHDALESYENRKTVMLARTFESFPARDLARTVRVLESLSAALMNRGDQTDEVTVQRGPHLEGCEVRRGLLEECRIPKQRLGSRDFIRLKEATA